MDRRSFLTNVLKAGAATAVAGSVSLVPEAESNEPAKIADFTNGTQCFVCGNTEGVLVAIGLYEDHVYYICKHGHIEAETYDIVTGLPAYLTSGDDGNPPDELIEIIKSALPTDPELVNWFTRVFGSS